MEKLMKFISKRKRGLISALAALLFIAYFYIIDPDNSLKGIVVTLQILIITYVMIIVIELLPDVILDPVFGDEKILVEAASQTAEGAGIALVAKSLRLLGYAIIAAGAIIAFTAT